MTKNKTITALQPHLKCDNDYTTIYTKKRIAKRRSVKRYHLTQLGIFLMAEIATPI